MHELPPIVIIRLAEHDRYRRLRGLFALEEIAKQLHATKTQRLILCGAPRANRPR